MDPSSLGMVGSLYVTAPLTGGGRFGQITVYMRDGLAHECLYKVKKVVLTFTDGCSEAPHSTSLTCSS